MPSLARPDTPRISQEVFDQYAANWQLLCSNPEAANLTAAFLLPDGQTRLTVLNIQFQALLDLTSAVGVRYIKVRFLATSDTAAAHFTMALFATDEEGNRLTAYYLADSYWENGFLDTLLYEVPALLGKQWTTAWGTTDEYPTKAAMFTTSFGILRGYNFEVADFLNLLAPLEDGAGVSLQAQLCLHTYYGPGPDADTLLDVFGVMMHLIRPDGTSIGHTAYDIAGPCPPAA